MYDDKFYVDTFRKLFSIVQTLKLTNTYFIFMKMQVDQSNSMNSSDATAVYICMSYVAFEIK